NGALCPAGRPLSRQSRRAALDRELNPPRTRRSTHVDAGPSSAPSAPLSAPPFQSVQREDRSAASERTTPRPCSTQLAVSGITGESSTWEVEHSTRSSSLQGLRRSIVSSHGATLPGAVAHGKGSSRGREGSKRVRKAPGYRQGSQRNERRECRETPESGRGRIGGGGHRPRKDQCDVLGRPRVDAEAGAGPHRVLGKAARRNEDVDGACDDSSEGGHVQTSKNEQGPPGVDRAGEECSKKRHRGFEK
ncbi:hypothetical protein THAOC_06711, partial [Thalassiosira oceanica]